MTKKILGAAIVLALCMPILAQQPQAKSQEELDALFEIESATDPDARIGAIHTLLTNFKDTEFKEFANFMMMLAYQQKNDYEMMLLYGENTLELNPDNIDTLVSLSYAIPARTGEFDLDKDEKLAKAEDYAKRALLAIPTLENPNPDVSADEWLMAKKDIMSQVHDSLGLVALKRKDYEAAEKSLRQSLQVATKQEAATFYHLADALKQQGKNDEALAMADQSIAAGGVMSGSGQDLAKVLKAQLIKAKAAAMMNKLKPAAKPAETVPEVEIVKQP